LELDEETPWATGSSIGLKDAPGRPARADMVDDLVNDLIYPTNQRYKEYGYGAKSKYQHFSLGTYLTLHRID
jgi:hypothetical protein